MILFFLSLGLTVWASSSELLTQSYDIIFDQTQQISRELADTKTEEMLSAETVINTNGDIHSSSLSKQSNFSLVFVGDMMFDRNIRQKAGKLGSYSMLLDPPLQELLHSGDLAIGNLEGPITNNASVSVGSAVGSSNNYLFTFDPEIIPSLDQFNLTVVNLGNNHILNFGTQGELNTRKVLDEARIDYFGNTGTADEFKRTLVLPINGTKVGFVNYNQFAPDPMERAMVDLAKVKAISDVQIVYTHWGNEYVPENATLKQQARDFVTAGADLIIGSHPHVITGSEVIDGVPVYYSLGNFIFDQYFEPAVQEGLVVKATFEPRSSQFTTTDYRVTLGKDGITRLKTDE